MSDRPSFTDRLAAELWEARENVQPLDRAGWPQIPIERGLAVAGELYAASGALHGAKLGVTDAQTQARLNTDRPIIAPVHAETVLEADQPIVLSNLIAPMLEVEIGVRVEGDRREVLPCIEIVDSRWSWDISLEHLVADFGAQAKLLFGAPCEPSSSAVEVSVYHDDDRLGSAAGDIAVARERAGDALAEIPALEELPVAEIATGALLPPIPLTAGRWVADFGDFGKLSLDVEGGA